MWLSWLECRTVHIFGSLSGHIPRLRVQSLIDASLSLFPSLSLSFSLPPPLPSFLKSIFKKIKRKGGASEKVFLGSACFDSLKLPESGNCLRIAVVFISLDGVPKSFFTRFPMSEIPCLQQAVPQPRSSH